MEDIDFAINSSLDAVPELLQNEVTNYLIFWNKFMKQATKYFVTLSFVEINFTSIKQNMWEVVI